MKKNKNNVPKIVTDHFNQISNTIELLQRAKFAKSTIPPILETYSRKNFRISWGNQVSGVNAGNFLLVDAYKKILENRNYQILLFDNSIIRCSFEFSDNLLITQNLLWFPCPFNLEFYKKIEQEYDIEDDYILDKLEGKTFEIAEIALRSPIRFDFDSKIDSLNHPRTHMHIQNPETRIRLEEPLCFNTFVKHIIETYYPESFYVKKNILSRDVYLDLKLDSWNGINIKTFASKGKNNEYNSMASFNMKKLPQG